MRYAGLIAMAVACSTASATPPPARGTLVVTIGTANPIRIEESAGDGSWVIACQARFDTDGEPGTSVEYSLHGDRGDRLRQYLVVHDGVGIEIQAFANQSPDDRWVAVVRDGKLELRDTVARRQVVLRDADIEDDAGLDYHSRLASFSNTHMIYFRVVRGRDVVVVRELATGTERTVDVPGTMWRADIDPAGRWARLRLFRTDDNGDGKIEWPDRGFPQLHNCFQGDPHASMERRMRFDNTQKDDVPTTVWLDLSTGDIEEDSTIIDAIGGALLHHARDGSLTLDGTKLVPAACNARLLGIVALPPRIVVACHTSGSDMGTLGVYGPGFATVDPKQREYRDPLFGPERPLVHRLCPRYSNVCVDVTTGVVTELGSDVSVWGQSGDLAFVLDHARETSFVWNSALGRRTEFPQLKDGFPDVVGILVTIAGERYDWVHNAHIGKATEWVHAVDSNGRILVGPPSRLPNHLPDGPVHWEIRR